MQGGTQTAGRLGFSWATGSGNGAARRNSPVTTGTRRVCRSRRSLVGWDAQKQPFKAYLYEPTGNKARAVKARYIGVCRGCGAPTAPRNGKGDAYAYCERCHPGAIAPQWTREPVREAMRVWRARYGAAPSSYDWSRTHARRRGAEALKRLQAGEWPAPSTVIDLYASWAAAVADAFGGA